MPHRLQLHPCVRAIDVSYDWIIVEKGEFYDWILSSKWGCETEVVKRHGRAAPTGRFEERRRGCCYFITYIHTYIVAQPYEKSSLQPVSVSVSVFTFHLFSVPTWPPPKQVGNALSTVILLWEMSSWWRGAMLQCLIYGKHTYIHITTLWSYAPTISGIPLHFGLRQHGEEPAEGRVQRELQDRPWSPGQGKGKRYEDRTDDRLPDQSVGLVRRDR